MSERNPLHRISLNDLLEDVPTPKQARREPHPDQVSDIEV